MAYLNPQPLPPGRDIRISAPASVLYDLEAFQRALAGVLGATECPGCTSGMNLLWQAYTQFAVDPAGDVRAVAAEEQ
jgi:hypothetical protein